MSFSPGQYGAKHIDTKYYPNDGDEDVKRPFEFCVLLAGRHAAQERNSGQYNNGLPAPEMNITQLFAPHGSLQ